jgi:Kef-type K+ transport system membrane component KefB/Trk K+ transport system NAD-binding subunit
MQSAAILNISFNFDFLPLLVVATLAWAIPMLKSLARLTKIPNAVLELALGYIIVSPLMDNFSGDSVRILEFLALTGFIFLMFFTGLEIDVNKILYTLSLRKISFKRFQKNPFFVGILIYVITLCISLLFATVMSRFIRIGNIWYFSLIMVTSSVGVILTVLKSREEINTEFGQMVISAAAIADIFSVILFTLFAFIIDKGLKAEVFLIIALFILFYIFYRIGLRLKDFKFFKKVSNQLAHADLQIKIRGTIFLILIFIVSAQFIDREAILLGAFLAGLLLSVFLYKTRSLLIIKLDGMGYGFFIPIFFIMIGARFEASDLRELDKSLFPFLGLLLVALYLVKIIPSFLWAMNFRIKKALAGGILITSRLSVMIAAAQIGLDLDIIGPGVNACFICMAVITCLFSPTLYNIINPRSIFDIGKTIVVGGSSTGVLLLRRLKMHGRAGIIIEKNKKRYSEILSKGLDVVHGDGLDPGVYRQMKLATDNHVVILTGSDEDNINISCMLREEFGHEKIISRAGTSKIELALLRLGVDVIDAPRVIATTIENLILRPATYQALVETFESFTVEEITVTNRNIEGLMVKEIPFHIDGFLMLIRRGKEMHVPHGDTHLLMEDNVIVFGTNRAVQDFRERLT